MIKTSLAIRFLKIFSKVFVKYLFDRNGFRDAGFLAKLFQFVTHIFYQLYIQHLGVFFSRDIARMI